MAEELPPDASIASAGLLLRYIGNNRVYAASGLVTDAGTGGANATLLDFVSGAGYIVGRIDFSDNSTGGADIYFEVDFNGETVIQMKGGQEFLPLKFDILIPPFTDVLVKWGSQSNFVGNCFLTGRVYES